MRAPKAVQATFETAMRAYRAGQKSDARAACERILKRTPHDARALYLLGTLELEAGRAEEAVERLKRAVALAPNSAAMWCNLGLAYAQLRNLDDAKRVLGRALELDPTLAEASFNFGVVSLDRGELEDALEHLSRAAIAKPASFAVQRAFARALVRAGRLEDGVERYRRALLLGGRDEERAGAHRELALAKIQLGLLEDGVAELERALVLEPNARATHSQLLFYAAFSPAYDGERILDMARRWNDSFAAPLFDRRVPHLHDRSPERRLRVGYVSPDFREHAQRLFTLPVLREHDRERFEIVCYSSARPADEWTAKLRSYADVWHDVRSLTDRELAARIREDQIDVLVDLTMHMGDHRLRTFAEKPAPVQIAWLAYPGTTGVAGMDYRLTDPHLDAPGIPLPYSEESLWLRDSFWCYDPASDEPAVNELPALAAGYPTFGCLNNFLKVNRGVLELWARVLCASPSSRLLLLAPSEPARTLARDVLVGNGVAVERIEFLDLAWRRDYLRHYQRIDLALDCFPYNGHTTSLDAFWMGVPVVTLVGDTVVGRAGVCHAHNLDLPELIATTPDEFVRCAVALTADVPRLAGLRRDLRSRLQASPLMDAPRFTRDLERLYREAWRCFCRG